MLLAKEWLKNTREVMDKIEATQMENIRKAAEAMADSIAAGRWVHTFGCGHATLPIEEMYPRIGGFVGFHPMIELPLSFFTHIVGEMGVHQFVFLERIEGYGQVIMKGYNFYPRDTMWIFSHSGINNVNIDVALESKKLGMKVIAYGSATEAKGKKTRHSCGKTIFDIADIIVKYNGADYTWTEATDPANGPIVDPNIYGWDRILHMYSPVSNVLEPGYAYWVYAYYNCSLFHSQT